MAFPNVYVPNFKLEDLCRRFSECLEVQGSEGQRFGGLEVWKCKAVDDLIFKLANVIESLSYLTEDQH